MPIPIYVHTAVHKFVRPHARKRCAFQLDQVALLQAQPSVHPCLVAASAPLLSQTARPAPVAPAPVAGRQ